MCLYAVHIHEISLFVICLTDISAVYSNFRIVPLFCYFLSHIGRGLLKALVAKSACVASFSVRFGSKERGAKVNGRAKIARVKEHRGVGKKGRVSFLPFSLPPLSILGCRSIFRAVKPKIPFLEFPNSANKMRWECSTKQPLKTSLLVWEGPRTPSLGSVTF